MSEIFMLYILAKKIPQLFWGNADQYFIACTDTSDDLRQRWYTRIDHVFVYQVVINRFASGQSKYIMQESWRQ